MSRVFAGFTLPLSTAVILFTLLASTSHLIGDEQVRTSPPSTQIKNSEDRLPEGALLRLGTLQFRHAAGIRAVAFSSNGKIIATLGRDHAARLWNRENGRLLLEIHERDVDHHHIAFSQDDSCFVLACSRPNHVPRWYLQVYDAETGKRLHRLEGHEQPINVLFFLPDGRSLASVSCEQISLWDFERGTPLKQIGLDWPTGALAAAPSHHLLAFASSKKEDPLLQLFDVSRGKAIQQIKGIPQEASRTSAKQEADLVKPEQPIVALAFSPNGKLLASGSPFEAIRLWSPKSGKVICRINDLKGSVVLRFSPDSRVLASADVAGMVRLWDAATGKLIQEFRGHSGWVNDLCFSPDGECLALAGSDSPTLYLWQLPTGKDLRSRQGHQRRVTSIVFSECGRHLLTAAEPSSEENSCVCVWDAQTSKELRRVGQLPAKLLSFAFSPRGRFMAYSDRQNPLPQIINLETDDALPPLQSKSQEQDQPKSDFRTVSIAFSPKEDLLAAGTTDGRIFLWKLSDSTCLRTWKGHDGAIMSLAFSPNAGSLLSAGDDRILQSWNVSDGNAEASFGEGRDTYRKIVVSPDGAIVAALSGWNKGKVYLWNRQSGKSLLRIPVLDHKISSIVFSPNSRMLAVGDEAGDVYLFEIATGSARRKFSGHRSTATALAFSPDGLRLASGSDDTTILIWDIVAGGHNRLEKQPQLSKQQLELLWNGLAEEDAEAAYRAIWQLACGRRRTKEFIRARLGDKKLTTAAQVRSYVQQLNADDYAKRQQAMVSLVELGKKAEPHLRAAVKTAASTELHRRIQLLLRRLEQAQLSRNQVRQLRAWEVLQWIDRIETINNLPQP